MNFKVVRYFLLPVLFGTGISAHANSFEPDKIQTLIDEAQSSGTLPAIGVLIRSNGKIVFNVAQGKRSMQNTAKVELQDEWHLGSDTKAMTAYLIALAVQDKRIAFDSLVVDFLDNTVTAHPLNKDLTLRDLLSHGSGLYDVQEIQNGDLWKKLSKSSLSLVEQRSLMMIAALQESPHLNPNDSTKPIRSFSYANINYMILGSILEKAYGVAWENLIGKRLFDPLHMSSCGFGVSGDENEVEPSQPWPHVVQDGQLIGVPPKYKADNPPMLGPAGTVHCNLEDWSKFILELNNVWRAKGQLLKNAQIASVYFSNAPNSDYTYGGWGRVDKKYSTPLFLHDGSNTFNYAVAMFAPEKDAFILLITNTAHPEGDAAMLKLKKSIADIVFSQ